jgi:SpoVK/Ycf46/Vps4 family AAA+-type ATPase
VGRPRRFDRVIKVGYPDEGIRRQYFAHKLEKKEVDKWTKKTDGLSFASLAELIISVKCLGKGFEESIELLNSLQTKEVSSDDGKSAIGFEK